MNTHSVSKLCLEPESVDCIVFWTKNPGPMLDKLEALKDYSWYFQFTLTPYESDVEANLPPKAEIIDTFKKLSDRSSPSRIIWRYDPVLITAKYNLAYHIDKFGEMAESLSGYTEKIIFSYIDFYKRVVKGLGTSEMTFDQKNIIAEKFSKIASAKGMSLETCAEDVDLSRYGIARGRCIDDALIAKIAGRDFSAKRDRNQRLHCGCVQSVDIGQYDSCANGCLYCYANRSDALARANVARHDASSPLLIGGLDPRDTISERKTPGEKARGANDGQMRLVF